MGTPVEPTTAEKINKSKFICVSTLHEILILIAFSDSEGSGKPEQMRRLAIAFAARIHKVWMQDEDHDQN